MHYMCVYCLDEFADMRDLRRHQLTHDEYQQAYRAVMAEATAIQEMTSDDFLNRHFRGREEWWDASHVALRRSQSAAM